MKTLVMLVLYAVHQMTSLKGRDCWKDLDIIQQISLLFIWLRIRTSGMLFKHGNEQAFEFHKMMKYHD
jgi:hypothetical protein